MKQISFYFDVISPYAYLAFHAMPESLQGNHVQVQYKPVLFGAILQHLGQLGPAEIPGKRTWTYQQVLWHAHQNKIPMQMMATHPFNPIGLLRLALACDAHGAPNRYVCNTLFNHVWRGGLDAADPLRLKELTEKLSPIRDPQSDEVKQELKNNTQHAIDLGIFGVPTFAIDEHLFWGFDALPMLNAYLNGDTWFASDEWRSSKSIPEGISRKR
jgi:2-hydroxychromene-2-carboxylate isomerase